MKERFGKPEIKKFCYHTACDLSCASVMVHLCNAKAEFICYWLVFTLFG